MALFSLLPWGRELQNFQGLQGAPGERAWSSPLGSLVRRVRFSEANPLCMQEAQGLSSLVPAQLCYRLGLGFLSGKWDRGKFHSGFPPGFPGGHDRLRF